MRHKTYLNILFEIPKKIASFWKRDRCLFWALYQKQSSILFLKTPCHFISFHVSEGSHSCYSLIVSMTKVKQTFKNVHVGLIARGRETVGAWVWLFITSPAPGLLPRAYESPERDQTESSCTTRACASCTWFKEGISALEWGPLESV